MEKYQEALANVSSRTKALEATICEFFNEGYEDQFNSTQQGIVETLKTKEGQSYDGEGEGLYVREGKPVEVVRITGEAVFQGPVKHVFSGYAVLVRHGPGKVNLCQSDVFEKTYFMEDGSPTCVANLPLGFEVIPEAAPGMKM